MKNGIEKTSDGVDKPIAVEMVKRYASKHAGQQNLTKSIWFSVERLDEIITLLKAERIMAGEAGKRYGIRFYMATHGPGATHINNSGTKREYDNRDTVLMVSTKQGDKVGEENFNVDYFSKYISDLKATPIENHGELCPEDCGGTDDEFK